MICVVPPPAPFVPSGMTKNGSYTLTKTTYSQVTGWLADTTNYPGSSVSSNGLVARVAGSNQTVAASIVISNSGLAQTVTLRLKNGAGTVIATGTGTVVPTGSSAPVSVTATGQTCAAGEVFTVEATWTGNSVASTAGTNTGSYVRIT